MGKWSGDDHKTYMMNVLRWIICPELDSLFQKLEELKSNLKTFQSTIQIIPDIKMGGRILRTTFLRAFEVMPTFGVTFKTYLVVVFFCFCLY
jgi:hypothetical protein